jgi:hypothetical protein
MGRNGFWTSKGTPWEPKAQWRYRVRIPGLSLIDSAESDEGFEDEYNGAIDSYAWYAKTIDKPSLSFNVANDQEAGIGQMYTRRFAAGAPNWKPVTMTLIDPGEPNVSRMLLRWVRRGGYLDNQASNDAKSKYGMPKGNYSPRGLGNALQGGRDSESLGEVIIEQIDAGIKSSRDFGAGQAEPQILESWRLVGAFPTDINFGKLDYSSDNFVEVSVTFNYRYAECLQQGGSTSRIDGEILFYGEDSSTERSFKYSRDPSEIVIRGDNTTGGDGGDGKF